MAPEHPTPWQRVFEKFGLSQRELGKRLGRDGAKINRVLKDRHGLINGNDQRRLLELAKECGVTLRPEDLVPYVKG